MRAFITALILLGILISVISFSSFYITKTVDELQSLLDKGCDIYLIEEKWKRSRGFLSLSTIHDNIYKTDSLIESARFFKESGNEEAYLYTLNSLRGLLTEIKSFEKLSFDNII